MKKFLLSIFAVLFAFAGVQAQEVTLDFTKNTWGFPSGSSKKTTSSKTYTSGSYSIVLAGGGYGNGHYFNSDGYLMNGKSGATLTLPAFDFAVSKIEVVGRSGASTSTAQNIYVGTTAVSKATTGSVGTNTYEINEAYQAAGNVYVLKISSKHNAQYTKIKIYKAAGSEDAEKTVMPVINPAGGQITADTEIAITSATEGAQIYYTINGDEPTIASTLYSGAFTLDAPATVKAIAVADGLEVSAVATAEFTFPVVCENIAAFIANADKDNNATISGEVVVVAQRANYLFIEDESGKMIVFGTLGKTYNAGDRLTGIKGRYTNFNGLHEMYPDVASFGDAVVGDAVVPVAITLSEIEKTDLLTYVKIYDVTVPEGEGKSYTVTDATSEATMYNTLGIDVPAGVATITGFIGTYNTTRQLMPLVIEITEQVVDVAEPTFTPESGETFDESLEVTITAENGLTVYYSINGAEFEEYSEPFVITTDCEVSAYAVDTDGNESEVVSAKYTKNDPVTPPAEGEATEVVDVLNREFTGIKSGATNYASWSDKKATSAAVYAGNSAGSNDAIQLRSNNSNSGIVTTVSGGKVKKISIDWNSNTTATRELWVYGKNTAYTNPTELYNASTDGDKLAEIACGTTEFIIEGDYEYIGLRSGSGAMYIDEIQITWAVEAEEPASAYTLSVTAAGYATLFLDFAAAIPAEVEAYTVTEVNNGYVTLTQVEGVLPANTGVIVKAGEGAYNFVSSAAEVADVAGNKLLGTVVDTNIEGEAYVLGNVGGVGLYKAKMTDGKWLNNANKAYLPASEVPTNVKSLSFRFGEGTTAIENVEVENEVKTIFDLTGRRVEAITAPGIYIINGKKVLVK